MRLFTADGNPLTVSDPNFSLAFSKTNPRNLSHFFMRLTLHKSHLGSLRVVFSYSDLVSDAPEVLWVSDFTHPKGSRLDSPHPVGRTWYPL